MARGPGVGHLYGSCHIVFSIITWGLYIFWGGETQIFTLIYGSSAMLF